MNSYKVSVRKVLEVPCFLLFGGEIISDEAELEVQSSQIHDDFSRTISQTRFECNAKE